MSIPSQFANAPVWDLSSLVAAGGPAQVNELLDSVEEVLGVQDPAEEERNLIELDREKIDELFLTLDHCGCYYELTQSVNLDDEAIGIAAENTKARLRRIRTILDHLVDEFERSSRLDSGNSQTDTELLIARTRQAKFKPNYRLGQTIDELGTAAQQAFKVVRRSSLNSLQSDGVRIDLADVKRKLTSPNTAVRKQAWISANQALRNQEHVHTAIFNGFMQSGNAIAHTLGAKRAEDIRHAANDLELGTIDSLLSATRQGYASFSHRYFSWKAKQLCCAKLSHSDRLAPIGATGVKVYDWNQARSYILATFEELGQTHLAAAELFFSRRWIDAMPRAGKEGGGFCLPGPANANPFVLVNFDGSARSVLELAHEVGHGVHYLFAQQSRKFGIEIPFPLAESTALFAERLAWEQLVENSADERQRITLLTRRAHDIANTVFRHMAIFEFEREAYQERSMGELSAERLNSLYAKHQCAALGPAFESDPDLGSWYITVPHLFEWPFYTYAYAYGELVAALMFEKRKASPTAFSKAYQALQEAGAKQPTASALQQLGIDGNAPATWTNAINSLETILDELGG